MRNGVAQYSAMIRHWLRTEPAGSAEAFADQAAQALWLEERHLNNLARALGARR